MSESTSRAEMEQRLVQRSLEDDVFRQQLLADPRAIIEREIGAQLPEGVQVVAVEETADTIYLVLPSATAAGEEVGELSDEELESVAGGGSWSSCGCPNTDQAMCPAE